MLALITGMLLCIGLALSVVGVVAIPARREGRELFRHVPSTAGADGDDPHGTDTDVSEGHSSDTHKSDTHSSEGVAVGASERRGADVRAG